MNRITPTIGRVLYYRQPGASIESAPLAAIIVGLAHIPTDPASKSAGEVEQTLSLVYWTPDGRQHSRANVRLVQNSEGLSDSDLSNGFAHWMPYQIGQANKTEDVVGSLAAHVSSLEAIISRGANRPSVGPPSPLGQDPENPPLDDDGNEDNENEEERPAPRRRR